MSVKCKFGFHTWDGCKCNECGKIRDEQHDWTKNCERCNKCGKTRTKNHRWENGKCSICGEDQIEGTFLDDRDGNKYNWIKIGKLILMAENLKFNPQNGNSWTSNNKTLTEKYGNLYDWETAKTAAPLGWHLPTKEEWQTLYDYFGGDNKKVFDAMKQGGSSHFNALFGGYRVSFGELYNSVPYAYFWSSTIADSTNAWFFAFDAKNNEAMLNRGMINWGFSVRLFADSKNIIETNQHININEKLEILDNAYLCSYDAELEKNVAVALASILSTGDNGLNLLLERLYKGLSFSENNITLYNWRDDTWNELMKKQEIIKAFGAAKAKGALEKLEKLLNANCSYGQWKDCIIGPLKKAISSIQSQ